MPRRPRVHLPDVPIHLVQRGHNREACFFTDEDFLAYREWLADALKKSGCALHAYVLMTNHVHLLLTPPSSQAVLQLVMSLGRRYVQYITRPTNEPAPCGIAAKNPRWYMRMTICCCVSVISS